MHFTTKLVQYQGAPCGAHPGALELNKPKARPQSLLEPSVKITGDLWSEGDVQIDGHLCGNINCAQLIVSKDAAVTGVIIAEEAVIRGKITGIIRATRVLLQGTARVESEIIYQSLSIDEGVTFEGVARPRLNPLEVEIAVSPMAELRQRMAQIEAGCANGAGPGCMIQAVDKAGPVSPPEPARQIQRSSAASGQAPEASLARVGGAPGSLAIFGSERSGDSWQGSRDRGDR